MDTGASLRLLFAGTPEFAAEHLRALLGSRHAVAAVYTQPDRPAGRGRKPQPSAVGQLAVEAGLPLLKPARLDEPACAEMAAFAADLLIVVAYGLILPANALQAARLGAINVHASLLPRWRGAAPIQRAIEAGDTETGISIMQMDQGLDTGPVLASARQPITAATSGGSLHDELARLGRKTLVHCLDQIADGDAPPAIPQPEQGACYARKLSKAEAAIDWTQPAITIERRIRAFNPWPVCTGRCGQDQVRIWKAVVQPGLAGTPGQIVRAQGDDFLVACGQDGLRVLEAQWPGGRRMAMTELLKSKAGRLLESGRLQ